MKNVLAAFLVILMAGCSGTREITKMEDYLTPAELENPNHQTVDKIGLSNSCRARKSKPPNRRQNQEALFHRRGI
jgi:hypothetical protein